MDVLKQRKLAPLHEPLNVPAEIAVCPHCDHLLSIQANEWIKRSDGTWKAIGFEMDCETEPDIDSDAWEDWWSVHGQMPYVYWMPIERKVQAWLNRTYDWDLMV